jgi:hypothetical protein
MLRDLSKWRVHHLKKSRNTSLGGILRERGDGTTHKTSPPSGCFPLQETVAAFLILACPELVEG